MTSGGPVRPIYVPPAGSTPTTGQEIGQKVATDKYWEQRRNELRGMREAIQEEKAIESLQNPPSAEPPIQMKGTINLGNIDFQEQARTAQNALEQRVQASEQRTQKLEEENTKLKNDLLATTINNMQTNLGNQIAKLQSDLAGGKGSSKSIGDQLKEIIDSANLLGYVKPEAQKPAPVAQSATDAAISLEMLRLQLQDKATERQFAWQMERDRRQWQLDLKKLDQANKVAMAEVAGKREKDQFFYQFPELIGNTIAKGLISSRAAPAGGGNPLSTAPRPIVRQQAPPPVTRPIKGGEPISQGENIENQAPASSPTDKVQAGYGEAGTIPCRECGTPIAIGPTASRAVCANCGLQVEVVRVGDQNAA